MLFALADELIVRTPCLGIDLPEAKARVRRLPEADDLAAIATAMRDDLAPMVWLGAVLGLRWGEVAALRVRSIDLLRRTVAISETVTRVAFQAMPQRSTGMNVAPTPTTTATKATARQIRLWREAQAAVKRLGSTASDPIGALADVRLVLQVVEERERELVTEARTAGCSWSDIGAALSVSKQAAWERWREVDSTVKGA